MTTVRQAIINRVGNRTGAVYALDALGIDPELDIDVLRRRLLYGAAIDRIVQRQTSPAIRKRVSDERLSKVAEIIDNGGGVDDVMESEHVGRRQAFRLIARAESTRRPPKETP